MNTRTKKSETPKRGLAFLIVRARTRTPLNAVRMSIAGDALTEPPKYLRTAQMQLKSGHRTK